MGIEQAKFENPEEQKGKKTPAKNMDELKSGKFSVMPEEVQKVRKKAIESGLSLAGEEVERAVEEFKKKGGEKMEQATSRLRGEQSEKAIKEIEAELNKYLGNKEQK